MNTPAARFLRLRASKLSADIAKTADCLYYELSFTE